MEDIRTGDPHRVATTAQLLAIDKAAREEHYNRWLELEGATLDPKGVHVLKPILVHHHAQGRPALAHMRVFAELKLEHELEPVKMQLDVPMEMWHALPTTTEARTLRLP